LFFIVVYPVIKPNYPSGLTYFNDPGVPEYRSSRNIASDLSWSPDGKAFVALLQLRSEGDKVNDFPGSILRISLP